jgi:dihydroxy-acid dehydratase
MSKTLRSHKWFWGANETGLLHRGALRSSGINMDNYHGEPVIGIANTWGELNNCNMSLRKVAEDVKEGIKASGGIPLEFPVITLGEELMKPTASLYRNLLSMDVEESLRSYPIDGVVLLGNCDKTVPGLLMGAVSANLPCIQLNAGPKKAGNYHGKRLGSGTDLWKYWDELRIGNINQTEWEEIGRALSCGFGSCNTMGTASTMNALLEVLGIMPLGLSTLPVDSEKRTMLSKKAGNQIVEMVLNDIRPSHILTPAAFQNAVIACLALGGSTNAIIHLTAIAGRLNINIYPELFDKMSQHIPCMADVQPAGTCLIDEFDNAGGVPALLKQLEKHLDLKVLRFTGKTLGNELAGINKSTSSIIRSFENPVSKSPTISILSGNLAPNGAVIKVAAASSNLLQHTGPTYVFDDYEQMLKEIDDENLPVDENTILILRNSGPKGVPGMPEWGMIPIPEKLRRKGVKDMVRISDARMSGTSFGTVILHVVPEAAAGGPLAIVKNGDIIKVDVANKQFNLEISEEEISHRLSMWHPRKNHYNRGYPKLYINEVLQADEGCDFDFLRPRTEQDLSFIEPIVGRS